MNSMTSPVSTRWHRAYGRQTLHENSGLQPLLPRPHHSTLKATRNDNREVYCSKLNAGWASCRKAPKNCGFERPAEPNSNSLEEETSTYSMFLSCVNLSRIDETGKDVREVPAREVACGFALFRKITWSLCLELPIRDGRHSRGGQSLEWTATLADGH